jgi:lipopolysaccharide export system permease protein
LAAGLRLAGLALNNVVVTNEAATPLLYALPLAGVLGSLIVMERARRRLSTSRFPGLIFDPISDAIAAFGSLFRRRPAAGMAQGRG